MARFNLTAVICAVFILVLHVVATVAPRAAIIEFLKDRGEPYLWTNDDVTAFAGTVGFADNVLSALRQHRVQGALLLEMDATDLAELGIVSSLERKRWDTMQAELRAVVASKSAAGAADGGTSRGAAEGVPDLQSVRSLDRRGFGALLSSGYLFPRLTALYAHFYTGGDNALRLFDAGGDSVAQEGSGVVAEEAGLTAGQEEAGYPAFSWLAWLLCPSALLVAHLWTFRWSVLQASLLWVFTMEACLQAIDIWHLLRIFMCTGKTTESVQQVEGMVDNAVRRTVARALMVPVLAGMWYILPSFLLDLASLLLALVALVATVAGTREPAHTRSTASSNSGGAAVAASAPDPTAAPIASARSDGVMPALRQRGAPAAAQAQQMPTQAMSLVRAMTTADDPVAE